MFLNKPEKCKYSEKRYTEPLKILNFPIATTETSIYCKIGKGGNVNKLHTIK